MIESLSSKADSVQKLLVHKHTPLSEAQYLRAFAVWWQPVDLWFSRATEPGSLKGPEIDYWEHEMASPVPNPVRAVLTPKGNLRVVLDESVREAGRSNLDR